MVVQCPVTTPVCRPEAFEAAMTKAPPSGGAPARLGCPVGRVMSLHALRQAKATIRVPSRWNARRTWTGHSSLAGGVTHVARTAPGPASSAPSEILRGPGSAHVSEMRRQSGDRPDLGEGLHIEIPEVFDQAIRQPDHVDGSQGGQLQHDYVLVQLTLLLRMGTFSMNRMPTH